MKKKRTFVISLLIVISFLAISYLAVIQANYAMIYLIKARILSILSIIICLYGFVIRAFAREQLVYKGSFDDKRILKTILFPIENSQKLIWIGLSIYTLNIWFILIVTLLSTTISSCFFGNDELINGSNSPKSSKKPIEKSNLDISNWVIFKKGIKNNHFINMIQKESLYALLIISLFVWLDTIREFSIWNEFKIRMFPKISLIIAIIIVVLAKILPKKSV